MNMIAEPDRLCPDVEALIDDYDNILCISAETLREMIVAFNNKVLASKCWKTASDMIQSLVDEYNLTVLPLEDRAHEDLRPSTAKRGNGTQRPIRPRYHQPSHHRALAFGIERYSLPILQGARLGFDRE